MLAVFIIGEFVLTNQRLKDGLLQIDRSLIAFTIFWALFEVIGPLCAILDGRTPIFSQAMIGWTVRVGRAIIIALGATAVLEVWGIHVGPVLASFGLVGVAVALGAQNLFKNLISGSSSLESSAFGTAIGYLPRELSRARSRPLVCERPKSVGSIRRPYSSRTRIWRTMPSPTSRR